MKEVLLALIKFAKEKGLGDVCLLIACFAMFFTLLNSAGFHPLEGLFNGSSAVPAAHAHEGKDNE